MTRASSISIASLVFLLAACPGREEPTPDGKEEAKTAAKAAEPAKEEPKEEPEADPALEPAAATTGAAQGSTTAPAQEPEQEEPAAEPATEDTPKPRPKPTAEPKPEPTAKIDAKALFLAKCKTCHGTDGKADTKMGEKHDIPDWTEAGWGGKWPRSKIVQIVTNGKSGTKMRPFKDKLSKEEIDALAAYIRKL